MPRRNYNPPLVNLIAKYTAWPHRDLIWQFARRDILARYRGSLLGLGWSVLTPLLMLAAYTFVFRVVFGARWKGVDIGAAEFAMQLYTGLIVFNFFSEYIVRAPRLVLDQPNLVKKVVFPLEILPWVALVAALFHLAVGAALLSVFVLAVRGSLALSMVALPLVWLPLVPLMLGCGWLFASLGVFVRDVGQIIGLLVSLLMFMSPVFFPVSALPEKWQLLLHLNPLTLIIEQTRAIVMDGLWPDWAALGLHLLLSVAVAWAGAAWFAATRKGFADVI